MAGGPEKSLRDLFVHALKHTAYAERAIAKALPRMVEKARHEPLKKALAEHLEETEGQIERLERVFVSLDLPPAAVRCEAIDGLLTQGEAALEQFADGPAADAAVIFACQAVEHYEINRYATLLAWAKELGYSAAARALKATLDEEYNIDDRLTRLAQSDENWEGAVRRAAKAA